MSLSLTHSLIENYTQEQYNKYLDDFYDPKKKNENKGFTALQVKVKPEEITNFIDQYLCSPNLMIFYLNFISYHSKKIQKEFFMDCFEYAGNDEDDEDKDSDSDEEEDQNPAYKQFSERENGLIIKELTTASSGEECVQKVIYLLVYYNQNHWVLISYTFEDNSFEFNNFKEEIDQDDFQEIIESCIQYLEDHYEYISISENLKIQKKTSFEKRNSDGGPQSLQQLMKYVGLIQSTDVTQINYMNKYILDFILLAHLEDAKKASGDLSQSKLSIQRSNTTKLSRKQTSNSNNNNQDWFPDVENGGKGKKYNVNRKEGKQFGDFYIKDADRKLNYNDGIRNLFTPESRKGGRQNVYPSIYQGDREKEYENYENIKQFNIRGREGNEEEEIDYNSKGTVFKIEQDLKEVYNLLSLKPKELKGICRNVPEIFLLLQKIQELIFSKYAIQSKTRQDYQEKNVDSLLKKVYDNQKIIRKLKEEKNNPSIPQNLHSSKEIQHQFFDNWENTNQNVQFMNPYINPQIQKPQQYSQQQQSLLESINNTAILFPQSQQQQQGLFPKIQQQQSLDRSMQELQTRGKQQSRQMQDQWVCQRYKMKITQQDMNILLDQQIMTQNIMSFMINFIQEKYYFYQFQKKLQNFQRIVILPVTFYHSLTQGYYMGNVVDIEAGLEALKSQDNTQILAEFSKFNVFEETDILYIPICQNVTLYKLCIVDLKKRGIVYINLQESQGEDAQDLEMETGYVVKNINRFLVFLYEKQYQKRSYKLKLQPELAQNLQFFKAKNINDTGFLALGILYKLLFDSVNKQSGSISRNFKTKILQKIEFLINRIGNRYNQEKLPQQLYDINFL